MAVLLLVLTGCSSPTTPTDPTSDRPPDHTAIVSQHSGDTDGSSETAHTGAHSRETGHSGAGATPYADCGVEPPIGPFAYTSTAIIRTEEDFDFDPTQYLLTQRMSSLAGITRTGVTQILVGNIGSDAAGIRSLPTGDVLVAQPDGGNVRLVDLRAGTAELLLSGLAAPNGLEVGLNGAAYVSELTLDGRIIEFDPTSGASRVIARMDYPNGMVLSPDEETLYVVEGGAFGRSTIVALDRDGTGQWGPSRVIVTANAMVGGLTDDHCGDLYAVEYGTGRVFRVRIPEGTVEPIADLGGSYPAFSAAHFSPGLAGWSTTELYVSNRAQLYVIDVGVVGRHVLR